MFFARFMLSLLMLGFSGLMAYGGLLEGDQGVLWQALVIGGIGALTMPQPPQA